MLATIGMLAALAAVALVVRYEYGKPVPAILDVGPDRGSSPRPVSLRGAIDGNMYTKVAAAIAAGNRDFTIDSSPGGSPLAAAIIAQTIQDSGGSLTAIGTCYSACALLLIGVKNKFYTPDADIEIHGARYKYPLTGQDPDRPARDTVAYLIANGTPPALAEKWGYGTNLHRLTTSELALIGVSLRAQFGS